MPLEYQRVSVIGKVFDTVQALKDPFDRVLKKAGIKDLYFHDLRHTFGSSPVQMWIDLYRVKELMSHKSIKMTERYAHYNTESSKPTAFALEKHFNFTTVDNEVVAMTAAD